MSGDLHEITTESGEQVYELVADVLAQVREELDDHKGAINDNTGEISLNQELLNELSNKIDRLGSRIDELTLLVKGSAGEQNWDIRPLSEREKLVCNAIFSMGEQHNNAVTYNELSECCKMQENTLVSVVTSIVSKGVPLVKRYWHGKAYLGLEPAFRQAQAKRNILEISAPLNAWN